MQNIVLDDVIAAISTPVGAGGIGIVRMSGTGCIAIADKVFQSKSGKKLAEKSSHTVTYGIVVNPSNGEFVDEVLAVVMKAPNTYTKEDIVEINCHGGILVVRAILELLLQNGARLAEPGEFTKRGFLNGRIDLTQAEAVIDLIHSKTELGRKSAMKQLEGHLAKKVRALRQEVLDMIAGIEAAIDYPEHDVEEETRAVMLQKSEYLLKQINSLLRSADKGKIIQEGLQTVIVGKPNVGKSSLLNYFLQEERAIVTDIPGTTRDTVEEYINLDGIPIKLIDTAGIRDTSDVVEKMGVEKSKEYAQNADLILMMIDASRPLDAEDKEILDMIQQKRSIILLNKVDLDTKIKQQELLPYTENGTIISLSVKEEKGMEELVKKIKELFLGDENTLVGEEILGNTRHKTVLFHAKEAMERVIATIESGMPEDFISMDLQEANQLLGEITGDSVDEEIIDRIFTKFCLGK
ncbi:MAG: tRNA uridine-5-carboxymethylaminomethyl(34) synthesis GTPase MnmE [Epulopiscium sp.]|jgi:tRNA modification GTPase|nr:tRNA uridine-5-carboxymethylaminomethyl(34) synthesis GTPase MnmE [Candidatus Epulonipiscium sp.]